MQQLPWLQVLAGLWLILMPFALGLQNERTLVWSSVVTGLVVAAVGVALVVTERAQRRSERR
ncbi:MAG: SPW repeat protein [Candidatus Andersenbacteria bacterium]